MSGTTKQVLTYFGNLGSSLPAAIGKHRGNLYWKQVNAVEDEIYAGVKDGSGAHQLRRILTKTYADTLYQSLPPVAWLHEMQAAFKHDFAIPAGTTFNGVGQTALTVAATASNVDTTDGPWVRSTTGAVSGNAAGFTGHASGVARYDWAPSAIFVVKTDSTGTSIREWVGWFASDPSGSADPAINGMGFRHDTGAGDTNWMIWYNDGSSTGTATSTGISYAASTVYRMAIHVDEVTGDVRFYINNTSNPATWTLTNTVTSGSANLPTRTATLTRYARVTTLSANTRFMSLSRISHYHER